MTLREAQKLYDDAISTTVKHKENSMTHNALVKIGQMHYYESCEILYINVGKKTSRIITSLKAKQNIKNELV